MKAEENRAVSAVPQDSPRKWPRKIVKIVGNILFFLFMILVALLLFFLVQSRATGRAPEIAGHYVLVVLSGSMFPRFNTGSAAFVKPVDAAEIKQGDIITFKGFAGSDLFTTHRVIGIKQSANGPVFTTKGDANHARAGSGAGQRPDRQGQFYRSLPGLFHKFFADKIRIAVFHHCAGPSACFFRMQKSV